MGAQEEEEPKDLRDMDGSALSNPSGAQVPNYSLCLHSPGGTGQLVGTADNWEMQGWGEIALEGPQTSGPCPWAVRSH